MRKIGKVYTLNPWFEAPSKSNLVSGANSELVPKRGGGLRGYFSPWSKFYLNLLFYWYLSNIENQKYLTNDVEAFFSIISARLNNKTVNFNSFLSFLALTQTCAESHFFKEKSSQVIQKSSHDLTFLKKTKKSKSWLWLFSKSQ